MASKNLTRAHKNTLHLFKFKNLSTAKALKISDDTLYVRFNEHINFYYKNKIKHICEQHGFIIEVLDNMRLVVVF